MTSRQYAYQQRQIAAGLCSICGAEPLATGRVGEKCRQARNAARILSRKGKPRWKPKPGSTPQPRGPVKLPPYMRLPKGHPVRVALRRQAEQAAGEAAAQAAGGQALPWRKSLFIAAEAIIGVLLASGRTRPLLLDQIEEALPDIRPYTLLGALKMLHALGYTEKLSVFRQEFPKGWVATGKYRDGGQLRADLRAVVEKEREERKKKDEKETTESNAEVPGTTP